ncbi:MAG: TIGR01777 family oxidoreductase [Deltaproteobacteria bacterium]
MKKQIFTCRTRIQAPADDVFNWLKAPGALERLTPPWERVKVLERTGGIEDDGSRVTLETCVWGISHKWVVEHRGYIEGREFRDVQISGPFASWEHTHKVIADGDSASIHEDRVEYALPMGAAGNLLAGKFVREKLETLFRYRHSALKLDIEARSGYHTEAMNILISGSTGLIGSALAPMLTAGGHLVTRMVRSKNAASGEVSWNPDGKAINPEIFEGQDAVIHLAGENIAGIWTSEKKNRIRTSRVRGTRLIAQSLAALKNPPKALLLASAIGFYGSRGDEILTEKSSPGGGFLANVCREWEAVAEPAIQKGIRVAHLRIGVVLSPAGGALKTMLLPFRLGVGGRIGSGDQYFSWIAVDDAIGAIYHALMNENVSGPLNVVSPSPATNAEFTTALGKVLRRPTLLPVPKALLRLIAGEMADEMLLASVRVAPQKLLDTGYKFRYPTLDAALRHLLGKN